MSIFTDGNYLSFSEIEILLTTASERDGAWMRLLLCEDLKPKDLVGLTISDALEMQAKFGPCGIEVVMELAGARDEDQPLILSRNEKPLSLRSMQDIMHRLCKRVDSLPKKASPQWLSNTHQAMKLCDRLRDADLQLTIMEISKLTQQGKI